MGWKLDTAAELSRLRPGGLGQSGLLRAMLRYGTPLLIVVIELFGAADIVYPMTGGARRFSADGLGIVALAVGLVLLCALLYFARLRRRDTGDNRIEILLDEQEAARRLAGPKRGWYREEAQVDHEE